MCAKKLLFAYLIFSLPLIALAKEVTLSSVVSEVSNSYGDLGQAVIDGFVNTQESVSSFYEPLVKDALHTYVAIGDATIDLGERAIDGIEDLGNIFLSGVVEGGSKTSTALVSSASIVSGGGALYGNELASIGRDVSDFYNPLIAGVANSYSSLGTSFVEVGNTFLDIWEESFYFYRDFSNQAKQSSDDFLIGANIFGNEIVKMAGETADFYYPIANEIKKSYTKVGDTVLDSSFSFSSKSVSEIAGAGSFWDNLINSFSDPLVPLFYKDVSDKKEYSAVAEEPSQIISPQERVTIERIITETPPASNNNLFSLISSLRNDIKVLGERITNPTTYSTSEVDSLLAKVYSRISRQTDRSSESLSSSKIETLTGVTITGSTFSGSITTSSIADANGSTGTAGYVLQSTASGIQWVATSSLGITGGGSGTINSGTANYLAFYDGTGTTLSGLATSSLGIAISDTTGTLAIARGGTGVATAPSYGQILVGNASGGYTLTATSSLGITGGSGNTTWELDAIGILAPTTTVSVRVPSNLYASSSVLVGGTVTASKFTATSSTASTFPYASSTSFTVSGTSYLGTVASGVWNGTAIGDAYITKTGDWTGTLDGQEGSYYLDATNLTNFGTPFYTFFSATTTDALTQGATNKYYSDSLVQSFIHASTTIPKTYSSNTFTGANIFSGAVTLGSLTGPLQAVDGVVSASSTLSTAYGGTGATSFSQGWIYSDGSSPLAASTSPTVSYIVATSTTASRFPYASSTAVTVTGNSYTGRLLAGNGSVSAPSISFENDLDTGFYSNGSGIFASVHGVNALQINTVATLVTSPFKLAVGTQGTAAAPGFALNGGSETDVGFFTPSNDTIGITTAGTERMRITDAGNIGIGTTSPYAKLSVVGQTVSEYFTATSTSVASTFPYASSTALTVSGSLYVSSLSDGCLQTSSGLITSTGSACGAGGGGSSNSKWATSTVSTSIYVNSATKVGIGTTTPQSLFHLYGGTYPQLIISDPNGGSNLTHFYASSTAGSLAFGSLTDDLSTLTEFARFDSSGKFGIGTTSPYAKLSVVGEIVAANLTATSTTATSTFSGGLYASGLSVFDNVEFGALTFEENAGAVSLVDMSVTSSAAAGVVQSYSAQIDGSSLLTVYAESDGAGSIQNSKVGIATSTPWGVLSVEMNTANPSFVVSNTGSSTPAFVVTGVNQNGKVGISTTTPWRTLSVDGTVGLASLSTGAGAGALCLSSNNEVLYNAGAACFTSSQRFKHDIENLDVGLDQVMQLRPVTFIYNDDIGIDGEQLGFIAEEVEQIDPRLVVYDKEGKVFSVKYEQFASLLTKAVQELNGKFDNLLTWLQDKIVRAQQFVGDIISARKIKVEEGLEIKDAATGAVYCVQIKNGDWVKVEGECSSQVQPESELAAPSQADLTPNQDGNEQVPTADNNATTTPSETNTSSGSSSSADQTVENPTDESASTETGTNENNSESNDSSSNTSSNSTSSSQETSSDSSSTENNSSSTESSGSSEPDSGNEESGSSSEQSSAEGSSSVE